MSIKSDVKNLLDVKQFREHSLSAGETVLSGAVRVHSRFFLERVIERRGGVITSDCIRLYSMEIGVAPFGTVATIDARDVDGVINETCAAIEKYLAACGADIASKIRNGYVG